MQFRVAYYIVLYYLIHVTSVVSSWWLCDLNLYCPSEETVDLKNEVTIGTNKLKLTCVAVMNQYSNVYWRIWNKDPKYLFEGLSACSKFAYNEQQGRHKHECELEIETSKQRSHTFTCHAGALSRDLYTLPETDNEWWSAPIFIQGANDSVTYMPSAEVEAMCIVDVSAKLYPADYAAQWLLVNDPTELAPTTAGGSGKNNVTNTTTLVQGMMTSESFVTHPRAQLKYAPSSDDDGKFLVCRCWHLTVLAECGHKNVQLKLNKVLGGNDSVVKNADADASLETVIRKSDSLTVWLSLGVVVASMALLVSLIIFLWTRCKTSKNANTQSRLELYSDIKKLYSVPLKKSQRIQNLPHDIPLQRIESEVYDSPYSNECVYVYSEFEDNSHIYGNFPVLISSSLPRSVEPVYANT